MKNHLLTHSVKENFLVFISMAATLKIIQNPITLSSSIQKVLGPKFNTCISASKSFLKQHWPCLQIHILFSSGLHQKQTSGATLFPVLPVCSCVICLINDFFFLICPTWPACYFKLVYHLGPYEFHFTVFFPNSVLFFPQIHFFPF